MSAIDSNKEKIILNNLNRLTKNQTTVIISHRVSALVKANNIIVLEEGEVIQQGNHSQLISKEGFYKEMYLRQQMEK